MYNTAFVHTYTQPFIFTKNLFNSENFRTVFFLIHTIYTLIPINEETFKHKSLLWLTILFSLHDDDYDKWSGARKNVRNSLAE